MFLTIAYENANSKDAHNFTWEVIEALFTHKETNKVKESYNRSSYKDARRGLIEWYANYLNSLN